MGVLAAAMTIVGVVAAAGAAVVVEAATAAVVCLVAAAVALTNRLHDGADGDRSRTRPPAIWRWGVDDEIRNS